MAPIRWSRQTGGAGLHLPERREVEIVLPARRARLHGLLVLPEHAGAVVVFAHGSGSGRHSPRNQAVAETLNDVGLATLLFDLLTPAEENDQANVFDIGLLADRLVETIDWLRRQPGTSSLPVGLFGASTGAAAALRAASALGTDVAAVVSRGGRPDLAADCLGAVHAPTLLVVGGNDRAVLELNRQAAARLRCEAELAVVPGATHLFEEAGALETVCELARDWFLDRLMAGTTR